MIPVEIKPEDIDLSYQFWSDLDDHSRFALRRQKAKTYEQWITLLYQAIDKIVVDIQDTAQFRLAESNTEDSLTNDIILPLRRAGFEAGHETNTRGHPDVLVTSPKGFKWIGEAKIYYGGYFNLWKGFLQLTTRYSNGNCNETHGGLIIYVYSPNAKRTMDEWRARLSPVPDLSSGKKKKRVKYPIDGVTLADCWLRKELAFFTTHNHCVSGLPYSVRHFPVLLHYAPKV